MDLLFIALLEACLFGPLVLAFFVLYRLSKQWKAEDKAREERNQWAAERNREMLGELQRRMNEINLPKQQLSYSSKVQNGY
jgi:hypothetical protein